MFRLWLRCWRSFAARWMTWVGRPLYGDSPKWRSCTRSRRFIRPVRDSTPHTADELPAYGVSSAPCPVFIRPVPGFHALSAPCGVFIPHGADEPPEYDVSSAPCLRTQRTKRNNRARSHRKTRTQRMKANRRETWCQPGLLPHAILNGARSAERIISGAPILEKARVSGPFVSTMLTAVSRLAEAGRSRRCRGGRGCRTCRCRGRCSRRSRGQEGRFG